MIAVLLAPIVALTVWYVAGQYGYNLGYIETLVYVIVAKLLAMYLKNDTDVEITVVDGRNTKVNPKEED